MSSTDRWHCHRFLISLFPPVTSQTQRCLLVHLFLLHLAMSTLAPSAGSATGRRLPPPAVVVVNPLLLRSSPPRLLRSLLAKAFVVPNAARHSTRKNNNPPNQPPPPLMVRLFLFVITKHSPRPIRTYRRGAFYSTIKLHDF